LYDGDNTYKGKPLFRAGIMDSGSIVPADPVDCPKGQVVYDTVVANAGCSSASDTLACLREVDYTTMLNAANSVPGFISYSSIALSYVPRPDGSALTASPDILIDTGKYAKVPFIVGDQEDEGTIFSIFQSNITTTAEVETYLSKYLFHDATPAQITELVATYPDDPSAGSPFRTGDSWNWYPQFKRLAALLGDLTFTLSRRNFLTTHTAVNPDVPAWSYLATYDYGTPILGTFHFSDVIQVFYGIVPDYASASIQSNYFSFVYNLDPNEGSGVLEWPQWSEGKQLMNFSAASGALISDDFRAESFEVIQENIKSLYV